MRPSLSGWLRRDIRPAFAEGMRGDGWPLALFVFALLAHYARLTLWVPGLSGDSARLGMHTLDFLQRGVWPFYIYHLFAPNPLVIYLDAITLSTFGFNFIALCSVSAFAASLAAPAAYLASRELFADEGRRFARRAGLVAAVGLTLSTVFFAYVPYGTEHALLPLLELLAVAALWRGLRRQRRADVVMAGVLLGVSQYAYIVARAFPFALAGALLCVLVLQPDLFKKHWRGLALTAGSAVLIALPQWILFLRAPHTFFARTEQSAGRFIFSLPNPGDVFLNKLVNQILMFGWHWDNGSHPGRPLLDPVLFFGLLVALGVILRRRRAGQVFGLALTALMFVPELLTFEHFAPSPTRIIGALPFVFVLAGMGCAAVWQWWESQSRLSAQSGALILAAVVLAGAERQWDIGARVAPQINAAPGREWDGSLVDIAEADYISQHHDSPILIPSSEYQRPPLAFLIADDFPERAGGVSAPLQAGEPVIVISPAAPDRPTTDGIASGYLPDEWVLLKDGVAYFLPPAPGGVEQLNEAHSLFASNGVLAATVVEARWQAVTPEIKPLSLSFENGLDLVGYHHSEFGPGHPLTVTLYWQPRRRLHDDVQVFTQILDLNGNAIAAIHNWPLHGVYRLTAWRPGEVVPLSYALNIPADAGPGPYRLTVGVWDILHQARVPLPNDDEVGTVAILKVPLPPSKAIPAQSLEAIFDDGITLSGYTLTPAEGALQVTLFWKARQTPGTNYTAFIHIADMAGNIVAQLDGEPLGGRYPTSIWSPGETVVDERAVSVPPGEYQVYIGLYRWDTLVRLPVTVQEVAVPDDRLLLGGVRWP